MKVTKIIREYIEEKINAKYDPMIKATEDKYRDANDDYQEVVQAVREKLEVYVREEFRKALAEYYTPEGLEDLIPADIKKRRDLVSNPYSYSSRTKHAEALDNELNALRTKRNQAIRNVLIGLELGGTKKDLDRLLEEALAEEV